MSKKALILLIICFCWIILTPTVLAISNISSESLIQHNSLQVILNSDSPVVISDETPDYAPVSDTVTVSGSTYDVIYLDNTSTDGNGIADADGNVHVLFSLNDDRPFFFAINHFDGENSKLKLIITIDGVTKQYTSNISSYVTHYIGYSEKDFSLPYLISKEDWIQSASEISVEIYNYNGHVPDNVTVSILFVDP